MTILFKSISDDVDVWRRELTRHLPEQHVELYPDEIRDPVEIDYAVVWKPPRGMLGSLPNLRAIFSMGAGVDHLANDPDLPRDVPVVRMVDKGLTERMTEYVTWAVLRHHRRIREYRDNQGAHLWRERPVPLGRERRVGIMGLGELGADAARMLTALRFDVAGWSNSRKTIEGVTSYAGPDELPSFLERTDILVCLLPLTEETQGILNRETLERLPVGACLVNAARGKHLVEDDLLALLASGRIGEATLDVFAEEPLPSDHPFWGHPRVMVTPHVASVTPAETAAAEIAANIRRIEAGERPYPVVDLGKGY